MYKKAKKTKKTQKAVFGPEMVEYFNIHDKYYAGLDPKNYMLTSLGFTLSDYIKAYSESKMQIPSDLDSYGSSAMEVIRVAVKRHKDMRSMVC